MKIPTIPEFAVVNEPMLNYAPGSTERARLVDALAKMKGECPEIPLYIGGKPVTSPVVAQHVMPSLHSHVLTNWHEAQEEHYKSAIDHALKARPSWEAMPIHERAAIFLKAADLISGKYRAELNAAVMLGQSKNCWQAEIDSAAETIDFFRFNSAFAMKIYGEQPISPSPNEWNSLEYRGLEGFVAAIAPFNFLAIAANLAMSPAIMGNVVVWKPSHSTVRAAWILYNIWLEAGLPPNVIQFCPGVGRHCGNAILESPHLAGLHFTGSTPTFNMLWNSISQKLPDLHSYPRLVGETGGKNFHFLHESCDLTSAVNGTVRGAFEYQGQKCSATSRLYVPDTLWPRAKDMLIEAVKGVKMGQPDDLSAFMCAVIDEKSFDNIAGYIDRAKANPACTLLAGGGYDKTEGFFVEPTVILTTDPMSETMRDEIFGPVLTVYVYKAAELEATIDLIGKTTSFGLTGSIYARERETIMYLNNAFRDCAGNFYINDKSTGAVVGRQPFGGARASGTNDKAGSFLNLVRWMQTRTIKESFGSLQDFRYPHQQ